jgi:hypothetical protein
MNKLKQYKTQIFNAITIFLIVTFVIFPGLTTANTFFNILSGISLVLLLIWAGLALYDYVRSSNGLVDLNELKEAEQILKSKQVGETELDYVPKPKYKATRKSKKAETK